MRESDKQTWHDYLEAYEQFVFKYLPSTEKILILEYGVLHGASIKLLLDRFPNAYIVGVDIDLGDQHLLPHDERVSYVKLDQRNKHDIRSLLANYKGFDLIIDDGSHRPEDQASCLLSSLPFVKSGGYYIVEDIHTNEAAHPNPLRVLLAIQHMKSIGKINTITNEELKSLCSPHYFAIDDILYLCNSITSLQLARRARLPEECWNCKGNNFDYVTLKCNCTQPLFEQWDSMSFMIRKS